MIHPGKTNQKVTHNMQGINVESVEDEQDMCVIADDKLSFHRHVADVVSTSMKC